MPISGTLNGMSTRYGLFHTGNLGLAVSPGSRDWVMGFWGFLVTCCDLHHLHFLTVGHWFRTHGAFAFVATSSMSLILLLEPCHGPQVLKSMAASGFLVPLLRAYSMVSTAMKQNNMLNTAIEPLHLGWIGQLNATGVFAAPLAAWLLPMAVGACSPPPLSAPKTAKPLNRWLKPFPHPSATCSLDSDSAPSLRGMISWICLLCKLERRAFTKLLGFWEF